MTPNAFRRLALSLPDVVEGAHMGHADFRVGGKIFATLNADETKGMVNLPPDSQAECLQTHPTLFSPCNGVWGRRGATYVVLKGATRAVVMPALVAAWTKCSARDPASKTSKRKPPSKRRDSKNR